MRNFWKDLPTTTYTIEPYEEVQKQSSNKRCGYCDCRVDNGYYAICKKCFMKIYMATHTFENKPIEPDQR